MIKENTVKTDVGVVIPAAGTGERFGGKKQFKTLRGRPIYYHALLPFLEIESVSEVVVVMPEESIQQADRELRSVTTAKSIQVIAGGKRRQDSVYKGINALSKNCEYICIHDAVRPFVTQDQILNVISAGRNTGGAILAIPAKDTVKQVKSKEIRATIPREKVWLAQTPQVFRRRRFIEACQSVEDSETQITDESSIMEQFGDIVSVVEGSALNIKITTPEDWIIAETIMNHNFINRDQPEGDIP